QQQPPCDPGTTQCKNGMIVCVGEVLPQPNICDKPPTDCTGNPNHSGTCPMGLDCIDGQCLKMCGGEIGLCPGGFVCDNKSMHCVPDVCLKVTCKPGEICELGVDGKAHCRDLCMDVHCPLGYICKGGVCVDDSCLSKGCP